MNKENKILSKNELCKIFNEKIIQIKKSNITDESFENKIKKYYIKNPINCDKGPKKGGYKLIELRNILVTYFDLNNNKAQDMNKIELCKYLNSEISKKKTKLLAIPTTAGSGAEVTSNAVIYINNLKYSVENDKIKPDYFCLLPELLLSSTKQLDATAGFDAVSQAVESLFSRKSFERLEATTGALSDKLVLSILSYLLVSNSGSDKLDIDLDIVFFFLGDFRIVFFLSTVLFNFFTCVSIFLNFFSSFILQTAEAILFNLQITSIFRSFMSIIY